MSIRTVLVPLDGSEKARSAIELAFQVGRMFAAHVEVLHVRLDAKAAVPLLGEGMSGAMIEEMIQLAEKDSTEHAKVARLMYDEFLSKFDIPVVEAAPAPSDEASAAWVELVGREDEVVATRGRLFDLSVVGTCASADDLVSNPILNAALFETGRPVLVAPQRAPTNLGKTIAVAWNGSTEGARAISHAMPFLKQAEKVYILTVETDQTSGTTATELGNQLAWHGINPEPVAFSQSGHSVGDATLLECKKISADMLVMGAYTHSRLRQMILGGVTRHVLESTNLPVLMCH